MQESYFSSFLKSSILFFSAYHKSLSHNQFVRVHFRSNTCLSAANRHFTKWEVEFVGGLGLHFCDECGGAPFHISIVRHLWRRVCSSHTFLKQFFDYQVIRVLYVFYILTIGYMVCKWFLYDTFTLLPCYVQFSELALILLGWFCFQCLYFSYIWKWKQNFKMYYSNQSHEDFFTVFF